MAFNNPVSTLGLQLQTTRSILSTQSELATRGNELGSGVRADVARDIGPRVGSLISFRADFEKRTAFTRSIEQFNAEAQVVQSTLQGIEESVVDLTATLAVGTRDVSILTDVALFEQANNLLDEVTSLLNTTVGGRFVFAGVTGDVQPVQGPDEPNGNIPSGDTPNNVFQALIAQWEAATGQTLATATAAEVDLLFTGQAGPPVIDGINSLFDGALEPIPAAIDNNFRTLYNAADGTAGNPRTQTRIDDGVTLETGIQADDAAFRDILAGLYFLSNVRPQDVSTVVDNTLPNAAGQDQSPYEVFFTQALDRLTQGASELRIYQAELGEQQNIATDTAERHSIRQGVLNGLINDLELVDPIETQVQFQSLETQLATNFEVTTRLLGLRLTNFLR